MSSTRMFLLSPALARLIERDRAGERVRQGYFAEQPDRSTHVQVTGDAGHLILVSHSARGPAEDAAEISSAAGRGPARADCRTGRISEHRHRYRFAHRHHPACRRSGATRSDQYCVQA